MTPQELKRSILHNAVFGKLTNGYEWIDEESESIFRSLWEVTYWDKKYKNVERGKQPIVISYSQVLAGNFPSLEDKDGDVYILSTGLYQGYTSEKKLSCSPSEGEVVSIPGGGAPSVKYWKGKFVTADNRIATSRDPNILSNKFLYYYMLSQVDYLDTIYRGTSLRHPEMALVLEMRIPVPNIEEQERIVAKIEELLPLIDHYEQAWSRLEDFNKRFPGDMQKSILQMAIQGKLVEQRPEEGTGEELYLQIQAEKQALLKAGKIKKEKPLPEIIEDDIPFDIPESWKWVRLSAVTDMLSGFAFKSEDFKTEGKYRLLRGINLGVNDVRWKETVYVDTVSDRVRDYKLAPGDVLLGLDRPWISDGTRVAIFDEEEETYLVQRVLRIKGLGGLTSPFIALLLRSSLLKDPLGGETTGISVPHISPNQVGNIAVPLPPLAEQKRIVARLEELLPLCERLKS